MMERAERSRNSGKLYELCQNLASFLANQLHRKQHGQETDSSLEIDPNAREFFIRQTLAMGIVLTAARKIESSTVTLQICIDPELFKSWRESLGPVGLVYLDPYGIEVLRDEDKSRWGVFLEGKELHLDLGASAPYLAAELQIRETGQNHWEVVRNK